MANKFTNSTNAQIIKQKKITIKLKHICYRIKIHDKFKEWAFGKYKIILREAEKKDRDKLLVHPITPSFNTKCLKWNKK